MRYIYHFLSLFGDFWFEGAFLIVSRKGKDSLLTRDDSSLVMRFGDRCLQSDSIMSEKRQKALK